MLPATVRESLRGFVNQWECDENAHWNVQFYCRAFDQAARALSVDAGAGGTGEWLPATRHLRFHAELVAGDIVRVRSARVADGDYEGFLAHYLDNVSTGRLAATALDAPGTAFECDSVPADALAQALPRGIDAAPEAPVPIEALLADGSILSHRCVLELGQCMADGSITQRHLVGLFSDAAGHVWEHAGVSLASLRERGLGRVAVEMKISHHAPARAGDALVVYSRLGPPRGKVVALKHQVLRVPERTPIACAEVGALLIDQSTRKAVPLPMGRFTG